MGKRLFVILLIIFSFFSIILFVNFNIKDAELATAKSLLKSRVYTTDSLNNELAIAKNRVNICYVKLQSPENSINTKLDELIYQEELSKKMAIVEVIKFHMYNIKIEKDAIYSGFLKYNNFKKLFYVSLALIVLLLITHFSLLYFKATKN